MKAHYYPSTDSEDVEQAPCGSWLGEGSSLTGFWGNVTCRRCFKSKGKITSAAEADEDFIVKQMGEMADFISAQESKRTTL